MNNRKHITLLGDSIFDNDKYVRKDCEVSKILSWILEENNISAENTLSALDGACIENVYVQNVPLETTDIFLSISGNDLLRYYYEIFNYEYKEIKNPNYVPNLHKKIKFKIGNKLDQYYNFSEKYLYKLKTKTLKSEEEIAILVKKMCIEVNDKYDKLLSYLTLLGIRVVVCDIYFAWMKDEKERELIKKVIKEVNKIIKANCEKYNVEFLEISSILKEEKDFSHEIEPSEVGGFKLAKLIKDRI